MAIDAISEHDHLYKYILSRRGKEGHQAYLSGGRHDAGQVIAAARRALRKDEIRILEFASGYGRVTRHLPSLMPKAKIVASDIHPEACDFIRREFDVETYPSDIDPGKAVIGEGYDFIFVLSLFSHLPHRTFASWLQRLQRALAPGGALLFTTHGETSKRRFQGIDLTKEEQGDGWIYRRKSDQPDIDIEEYGTMIVTPRYVLGCIEECKDAELLSFWAGPWLGHQDEWMLRRPV
jgi:SAM-dependent methyltransferase